MPSGAEGVTAVLVEPCDDVWPLDKNVVFFFFACYNDGNTYDYYD